MLSQLRFQFLAALLLIKMGAVVAQENLLDKKISIEPASKPAKTWLSEVSKQEGVVFSYRESVLPKEKITIKTGQITIGEFLDKVFEDQSVAYRVKANKIIISKKTIPKTGAKNTLHGYLKDANSGEELIGATVLVVNQNKANQDSLPIGAITNAYGFYSITIPPGQYLLRYQYVGFESMEKSIDLSGNTRMDLFLTQSTSTLEEVVIEGSTDAVDDAIESPLLGVNNLSVSQVKVMPALFGEADVIKAVQLLPGVKVQGEGSTNFYVRGGAADQNLILIDEAPIYNPSHLLGFFSVFNPDAIKNMTFYKGSIPASYGGRLSSVLDIRLKDGNDQQFGVSGGIGLTASRLTLEGPIRKGKSSFIVSARRTYADLFLNLSGDEFTRATSVYFYDLNAKANFELDPKNKIYFSGYFGRDVNRIRSLQYAIDWGNATGTARWNHLFNDRLFANTTFIYSNYDYLINLPNQAGEIGWESRIRDITAKVDFTYFPNPKITSTFGLSSTFHQFSPGKPTSDGMSGIPDVDALEHGVYFSNHHEINNRWALEYGIRYSLFQLIGSTEEIVYNDDFEAVDTRNIDGGVYQSYMGLEPRISGRYKLSEKSAVKIGYDRNRQYIQLLSNLALGLNVFDIWFPSTRFTEPQTSDQFSLSYNRHSKSSNLAFVIEGYYKRLQHQIDYRDHARLILNRFIEGEIRQGRGRAYGVETSIEKTNGKLTGWISYTWSRATRQIEGINNGNTYPAFYDQPHQVSIVGLPVA